MLADGVEQHILFGDDPSVSSSELLDWLAEDGTIAASQVFDAEILDRELAEEEVRSARSGLRASRAEGAGLDDLLVGDTMLELERRARVVGALYPFNVVAGRVVQRRVDTWRDAPAYSFMLALSVRLATRFDANLTQAARLFERLVVPALQRLWCGEAAHFGWPRDRGEVPAFPAALQALVRDRMGERLNVALEELPHRLKDLEVDAVAWRPVDDRRGQTVLLCQCAVGADWEEKGVHVDQWMKIVTFAVVPYKAMAFPFVPEVFREFSDTEWELMCGKAGLPLDRLRIARLLDGQELSPDLVAGMTAWVAHHEELLRIA